MRIGCMVAAAALAGALWAAPARADAITFFGEDAGQGESTPLTSTPNALSAETDFLAFLDSGVTTQTFESFTAGLSHIGLSFAGSGGSTIQAAVNGTFQNHVSSVASGSTDGYGRYAISGTKYYDALTTVTISMNADTSAFGFWGVDVGDFDRQLRVVLTDGDGNATTYTVPNSTGVSGGGVMFWGLVTEDAFRTIQIQTIGATGVTTFDRFALDDLTIGERDQIVVDIVAPVVPEPGSLFLLGAGALGLVGVGRRNRRAKGRV